MSTEDLFTDMYNWKYGKSVRQVIEALEARIAELEKSKKETEETKAAETPHWGMI